MTTLSESVHSTVVNQPTPAVKKAIKWVLENEAKLIAKIEDVFGKKIADSVRQNIGPVRSALKDLLGYTTVSYKTIEDHVASKLSSKVGLTKAKAIGVAVSKAIELIAPS
ncbi:hypothetical protein P9D25_13115 [Bacillus velezensis]|uniref:hypothetical protein n=1 Tax=Bacillus velezensis TaxID=492670 RepID=UPI002DC052F8|nr:hypothetical protein [Bacillus velezensis]MEC1338596.1 hypothetical protein [Bacillus velezensis]